MEAYNTAAQFMHCLPGMLSTMVYKAEVTSVPSRLSGGLALAHTRRRGTALSGCTPGRYTAEMRAHVATWLGPLEC